MLKQRSVDSLATEMGLSIANASQHLQVLRESGRIESRKEGLFVHYRLTKKGHVIDRRTPGTVENAVEHLLTRVERRDVCVAVHVLE